MGGEGDKKGGVGWAKIITDFSVYVCADAPTIDIRKSRINPSTRKIASPVGADEIFSSKTHRVP